MWPHDVDGEKKNNKKSHFSLLMEFKVDFTRIYLLNIFGEQQILEEAFHGLHCVWFLDAPLDNLRVN